MEIALNNLNICLRKLGGWGVGGEGQGNRK